MRIKFIKHYKVTPDCSVWQVQWSCFSDPYHEGAVKVADKLIPCVSDVGLRWKVESSDLRLHMYPDWYIRIFFKNVLRWQVTILWSHWYSLFWTSVDSAHGFQSQGGSIIACCCLCVMILRVNYEFPGLDLSQFYALVQWGYRWSDRPTSLPE